MRHKVSQLDRDWTDVLEFKMTDRDEVEHPSKREFNELKEDVKELKEKVRGIEDRLDEILVALQRIKVERGET